MEPVKTTLRIRKNPVGKLIQKAKKIAAICGLMATTGVCTICFLRMKL
jgi:hypothetical protein